ncbi:uncharacterized protein B0I36DRAFT_330884 [Microdochium trichocladiopsis]|uniref:DUF7603 domain-containing protein n=1 Tax=Microdochium trichocladiopsis TaxID=1682393 RepID=A0A9P8Y0N3_9PEZI|nr:uncharacterized protein B0I36DRAFT_330884 [Microdochium trichocladiopsis]KAH7026553.1 hypothetical protein B0I36DRAFT_330884 [Microdochium trichocladiopsis]
MSGHAPPPAPGPGPSTREGSLDETFRASSHVAAAPPPHHHQQQHSPPQHTADSPSHDSVPGQHPSRTIGKLVLDNTTRPTTPTRPPSTVIRRKPVSSTASPIATRYSSGSYLASSRNSSSSVPAARFSRSFSVDSPTVYEFPESASIDTVAGLGISNPPEQSPHVIAAQDDKGLASDTQGSNAVSSTPVASVADSRATRLPTDDGTARQPSLASHTRSQTGLSAASLEQDDSPGYTHLLSEGEDEDDHVDDRKDDESPGDNILDGYASDSSYGSTPLPERQETMSLHVNKKSTPPHLVLKSDEDEGPQSPPNNTLSPPNTDKPLPKSPASSKFGTFFGWGSPATSAAEPSEKTFSPLPSPFNFSKTTSLSDDSSRNTSGLLETPKALHGSSGSREYCESYLATPPVGSSAAAQLEEMEDELKAISVELAASIRREMDLEDLVDRLQAERDNPTTLASKRTSDYFSDSGYSSAKSSEYDQSREEVEKIQRRADQEKAQIRLELTDKLQDERSRRSELDKQIRVLSEKASQIDLAQMNNLDVGDRVKELESTCETLRRKLSEERKVKDNFEDLLAALRGELQNTSNERDNLRDEIVPNLRARVEGLESQAADIEKMTYETTKMQQELQILKQENTTLKHSKSMQSITEEGGTTSPQLSRSNSITGGLRARPSSILGVGGLSRSKTVRSNESRDQLSERLKDVEEQRDALHRALKALLDRQEFQNRENAKKIRNLEQERDRFLSSSPQKAGFQDEVSRLKSEIAVLRRRSEEAIEQKWQIEKGLVGLKMDLDRAQQEIASLRSLLDEKDILIPEALARASSGSDTPLVPVTSESLTATYRELQQAYTASLERIKALEDGSNADEKTKLALERLETSLASVVSERNIALQDSAAYQAQLNAIKDKEREYIESEKALADELSESARRVEELAIQVRQQLATNNVLRERIAETVARGETEHKANRERITTMQARMRYLEDKLEACQAMSEERLARHEEELQELKDSHGAQLRRMRETRQSAGPKSPRSPLFSKGTRNPRLSMTTSGEAVSLKDDVQVDNLRARIAELENSLTDADAEMQEVVGRMQEAQIQVLQLQEEREAAVRDTRRLEKLLQEEKVKAFEEKFKTLQA